MLVPGSLFASRYRVLRALKSGAMGWVYVAEHVGTNQRVALKLMKPEIIASPELRAKFSQEARVAAMIQSRHVVAVTDSGVEESTPFLVMELLDGQELGEILAARGALAPGLAASILGQLAKGLDKAHAAGVIHRDLKPENVFLARDEDEQLVIKILDFGIAKLVQGASSSTVAGGTPLYMAPEQTRNGALTPAVDIWAFGLIAYRMLAGTPYWQALTLGELYAEITGGAYALASSRSPTPLPPGFDEVFARCVALDPAARFSSAGEAAKAMASVLGAKVDASATASTLLGAPRAASSPQLASSGPSTERISAALAPTAEVKLPSASEVKPPSTAEVKPPSTAEVKPPSTAEVKPPSTAEVKPPSTAEVKPPSTAVGSQTIQDGSQAALPAAATLRSASASAHPLVVASSTSNVPRAARSSSRRWVFAIIGAMVIGLGTLVTIRLATHGLSDFTGQQKVKKPPKKRAADTTSEVETAAVPPSAAPEPPTPSVPASATATAPPPPPPTFGVPTSTAAPTQPGPPPSNPARCARCPRGPLGRPCRSRFC